MTMTVHDSDLSDRTQLLRGELTVQAHLRIVRHGAEATASGVRI
jgi:hypothetical protein